MNTAEFGRALGRRPLLEMPALFKVVEIFIHPIFSTCAQEAMIKSQ